MLLFRLRKRLIFSHTENRTDHYKIHLNQDKNQDSTKESCIPGLSACLLFLNEQEMPHKRTADTLTICPAKALQTELATRGITLQNHKMFEVGRDLSRSASPKPLQ